MNILHIGFPNMSIYRACTRRHHQYEFIDSSGIIEPTLAMDNLIISKYDEWFCDTVFIHAHSNCISIDTLKLLKAKGAKIMHFTWDIFEPILQFFIDWAPYCITAFTNMNDVNTFKKLGFDSIFLPYGFDESIYTPYGTKSDTWGQIVFMGNNHDSRYPLSELRTEMVFKLQEVFGDKFQVYGNGWNLPISKNLMYRASREAEAYRSCVIAINLSSYDRDWYSSDRLLRAMACGACVLSKTIPEGHPGMIDGTHYVQWNDLSDLIEKIKDTLQKRIKSLSIGKTASDLVHSQFRFDQIIKNLE